MMGRPAREWRTGKMANWSEWSHSRPFVTAASTSFHQGILVSSELLDYQQALAGLALGFRLVLVLRRSPNVGPWQPREISPSQFPIELQHQVPFPKSDLPDHDWSLNSGSEIYLEIGA